MRKLTDELWASIGQIYKEILAHPFIEGLTTGTLDREAFRFYVVQDAHYLREFARALAVCGAKAPEESMIKTFCDHASGAIAVERQLHESFFRELGMSEAEVRSTPMAPTNVAYTSYLLAVAHSRPFPEALGAVLPCYWIYWEVGKALLARGSPDPLYRRWIDTYAGDEFAGIVRAVLSIADRIGQSLGAAERAAVGERFVITSRYEWMFWDMGLRKEAWPV